MQTQYQNETQCGSQVRVRPTGDRVLVFKALFYLAAGILGIDFLARLTLGQ